MTDVEAITTRRAVELSSVADALADLWRGIDTKGEEGAVIRACGLTVVALCGDPDEASVVASALARATAAVPARTLVVVRDEGVKDGISAEVSAFCSLGPGGKQVCQEQVFLSATGARWNDLPPLVGALPVPDLPVVLVARDPAMLDESVLDGLLPAVDLVVTDLARSNDPRADLPRMRAIEERLDVGVRDLAFERLIVWRTAIACAWDRVATGRTALLALETTAPKHDVEEFLLAAWVAARLRTEAPRITTVTDDTRSRLAAVRMVFDVDGATRTVRLGRHGDHVIEERDEGAELETCALPRPMPSDIDLLPGILADPQTDPLYDETLRLACERARRR